MRTTWQILGDNIRLRRRSLKMSQAELGKLAGGLSFQTINRFERGRQQPRKANLEAIAKALECSTEELMIDKPTPGAMELAQIITRQQEEIDELKKSLSRLTAIDTRVPEYLAAVDPLTIGSIVDLLRMGFQARQHQSRHKKTREG